MLLAVSDGDSGSGTADHFKFLPVHDDGCARVHADAQQFGVCRHDRREIAFAVALAHMHINHRVRKKSEPRSILLRDQASEVFVIDTATHKKRAQNQRPRGSPADHATAHVERCELPLCPCAEISLGDAARPPAVEPNSPGAPDARRELLPIRLLPVVGVEYLVVA